MPLIKDKIELEVGMAELRTQQALLQFPKLLRWLLIIFVLAILPGYFIAKKLAYSYWTGKYSANLISARPSFTDAKAPGASGVFVGTSGPGVYNAAMEISNDNVDLALPTTEYEFSFFNKAGEQVYKEKGTAFLLPDEKKYLVVPKFFSPTVVTSANFRWTEDLHWEKRLSIPNVVLRLSQPNSYNQFLPQAFVIEGNYFNSSPYQLGQIRLTFLILDKSGKIIGSSRRDDFTVAPGESRSYKQIWPNVFGDPSSKVRVYAETNVLDSQNLGLPPVPTTPASDLSRPKTKNNN